MFTVEVRDDEVKSALGKLAAKINNMRPKLEKIGEGIAERAEARFATCTGPGGQRWAPNARSTIEAYIASKGGYGKKGITEKGQTLAANKKPLTDLGHLSHNFHVNATATEVTIGNSKHYAAIQQFGGKKSQFPNLWGDIPARPFLPVTASGDLYPEDKARVLDSINAWLMEK